MDNSRVVTGVLCLVSTAAYAPQEQAWLQLEETVLPSDVGMQQRKRNWAERSQRRVTLNQLGLLAHWCRNEPCLPQCVLWLCILLLYWRIQENPATANWLLTSLIFDPVDGAGVQMLTCQPSHCGRHCILVAWYLPGCVSGYTDWAMPVENPSTGMVCS